VYTCCVKQINEDPEERYCWWSLPPSRDFFL